MADTKTTDLATTVSPEEQALIAASQADIDADDLVVPHLKLVQGTTKDVPDGVLPGQFLNALTGQGYEAPVEFLVAGFRKGRFGVDEDENLLASGFGDTCLCHDLPFPDCPNAEEQWRAAVNREEKEWGSGPPISTTYNFFGYVGDDEVPVRLSLMRTGAPMAKKWLTMMRFLPAFWDVRFSLDTKLIEKGRNKYYVPEIKQAGKATPEQRQLAVGLATALASDRVKTQPDGLDEDAPAKPDPGKGLGV